MENRVAKQMENARSPREGARTSATGMADKVWADIEKIKDKGEFIPPSPQDVEQGPPANRTTARGPKRNLEMKLRGPDISMCFQYL
ncbi:MAG TPA: hypothetical protein DIV54_02555 [Verrucomicrobiales bacterium]|nr:hypothetical protein [Verrucomicrobiales bacterium]|tara:strand:- start:16 stop:273 length:258 start_codon:yes stop_codon:yes gene_type:complete